MADTRELASRQLGALVARACHSADRIRTLKREIDATHAELRSVLSSALDALARLEEQLAAQRCAAPASRSTAPAAARRPRRPTAGRPPAQPAGCNETGCNAEVWSRGKCLRHYRQYERAGRLSELPRYGGPR